MINKNEEFNRIIKKIENEKFIVYGAGGHGKKFVKAIIKRGCYNNFVGYAVTKSQEMDKQISEISDVCRNQLVIIAAHEKNAKQMEKKLLDLGFQNYINIYPYMTELYWGTPYLVDKLVNVEKVVAESRFINYRIALYAGIDSVIKKNEYGEDIYLKTLQLTSDKETARIRWEAFQKRIDRYEKKHEIEKYNIQIDPENKYILDGTHRLMLAYYFKIPQIKSDFFRVSMQERDDFYNDSIYEDDVFLKHFTLDEQSYINEIKKRIHNIG